MSNLISVRAFGGEVPRLDPRLLQGHQAQLAQNVDLWAGDLRPTKAPSTEVTLAKAGTKLSIYPLGGEWLHWITDVDAVPGPIATSSTNDEDSRTYYTGDKNPKSTNITLATVGAGAEYPLAFYRLGLPKPDNAPAVAVTGGTTGSETRSYVYTFVTAWGEQSRPSDPTTQTGFEDATSWDLSGMDAAPVNVRNITNITFASGVATIDLDGPHLAEDGEYWSFANIAGAVELNGQTLPVTRVDADTFTVEIGSLSPYTSGGDATREAPLQTANMEKFIYRTDALGNYLFVDCIPASQTTYSDTKTAAQIGPDQLKSEDYYAPPGDLAGLIALPNGSLAGFTGNQVCVSEPNQPHAWPLDYRFTTAYPIVGLAERTGTVIVATTGKPERLTGRHPAAMSLTGIDYLQPCVSKRSIQPVQSGVMYASEDGLVYIGPEGAQLVTQQWVKKKEWATFNPSTMIGGVYDNRYYGFHSGGVVVFDPSEGLFSQLDRIATGAHTDLETDSLYFIESGDVVKHEGAATDLTSQWDSKIFALERALNLSVGSVNYVATGGAPSITFRLYAKDDNGAIVLKSTVTVTAAKPFRLPSGYFSDEYYFDLTFTDVAIKSVAVAESRSELIVVQD